MLQLAVLKVLEHIQESVLVQALLVALLSLILVRYLTRRKGKQPPGPTPYPLIGNLLSFRNKGLQDLTKEFHAKYGSVFQIFAGPKRIVVINDIDNMMEAFVERGTDFAGRPKIHSLEIASDGYKDIVFSNYGESWKFQRKIAVQAIRAYSGGSQLEQRVQEVVSQMSEILKQEKEPFNPHTYLSLTVFNIINGLCFGKTFPVGDPTFDKLLDCFDKFLEQGGNGFLEDFIPLLKYWPTKRFREVFDALKIVNDYNYEEMKSRKENFSEDSITCIADNIILAQKQAEKEHDAKTCAMFTDVHAGQTCGDIFGAGVDTTRVTLDWFFLVMCAYPDVQERIHKEIDAVIGSKFPGKEHRSKLVYLEAALAEAMRLYPVAPFTLPHTTIRDTTVGGFDIPNNTMIVVNQLAIMRDPKNFEDPLTYKPERFLDETKTKLVMRNKSFIPFSAGARACLGETLARLDLVYIIAGLLQKFKFSLPEGETPNFESIDRGFGLAPQPYKVVITIR